MRKPKIPCLFCLKVLILTIFFSCHFDNSGTQPENGQLRLEKEWLISLERSVDTQPVLDGDTLYFQDTYNGLFKVGKDGNGLVKFNSYKGYGIPVILGDHVCIGSGWIGAYDVPGSFLWLIDKHTFQPLWVKEGLPGITSPAIDETTVYAGSKSQIAAFDRITGEQKWLTEITGKITYNPTLDEDRLYFASLGFHRQHGYFYSLDKYSGNIIYQDTLHFIETNSQWGGSNTGVTIWQDKAFVVSQNRYIYCFNKNTGEEIWKYLADSPLETVPVVSDGIVYTGSLNRTCYALDAQSGNLIWEAFNPFSGSFDKTPPQIYQNYVLLVTGSLRIFDKNSGKKVLTGNHYPNSEYSFSAAKWSTSGHIYAAGNNPDKQDEFFIVSFKITGGN